MGLALGLAWGCHGATQPHTCSCSAAQKCCCCGSNQQWRRARPVRVACQAGGLTSRMSIRPSMDPEEMSWPGDRAPLDGDGWRSEQAAKRDQLQVRPAQYVCTPSVCVRRFPLRQREATTAEHKQGVTGFCLRYHLACFPWSFLFPIKIHRDLDSSRIPSLAFPCLPCLGCLFVFSLPSFLRLPLAHLLTPSKHPELPCD